VEVDNLPRGAFFVSVSRVPSEWRAQPTFPLSSPTDTPSFAITRTPGFGYPLREGIPVSLKCDVDSNPPSSAMWQKDDGDPPVGCLSLTLSLSPEAALSRALLISLFLPPAPMRSSHTDTAEWRRPPQLHRNTSRALGMVQMYSTTPQQAVFKLRLLPQRSL
jgi:hypothetical protein